MNKQEAIQLGEEMKQNPFIKCNHCNSPFVRKEGKKYYKYNDLPKQKYYCNDCKKNFVLEPSRYKPPRKVPDNMRKIILNLKDIYSQRNIQKILFNEFDFKISHTMIWKILKRCEPK